MDCGLLLLRVERAFRRRHAARISQREQKKPKAAIGLVAIADLRGLPLYRREAAENVSVRVQYHSQSVRAAIAAVMAIGGAGNVAAAAKAACGFLSCHFRFFKPICLHILDEDLSSTKSRLR
jgi:hypothetical protein